MRTFALLFLMLGFLLACTRPTAPAEPVHRPGAVILSTTIAPGSAFKVLVSFDPPQPVMSQKTRFRVTLSDLSGAPVGDAKVQASLVMPLMDMGKNEFPLQPKGGGMYEGTGQFTMSGEWEVVVTAKAGSKSGKTTFNVRVED